MFITDLDYLETSQDQLSGGFISDSGYVDFKERIDIKKYVNQYVNLYGDLATAESDADALGKYGTTAQTFTRTTTVQGVGSSSQSTAISASDPWYW
jgi:hypothetical protein